MSVITPSFNPGPFLEEALDSVRSLEVPHEHIVVDGGSSDGAVELLHAREDSSLSWISEPDRGQTHAVNKGLKLATGDLIGWLNADDAYVSAHVDEAVRQLRRDPDLEAVFGQMDVVDASGEFVKRHRPGRFSWNRYLYFGYYLPTPTIIFRRSLLAGGSELDERFSDAADYDFYLRLLRHARVQRVERPLVRFRYHAGSKTAGSVAVQRREGLEIRLRYARHQGDRWLMNAVYGFKGVVDAVRSPWPKLRQQG